MASWMACSMPPKMMSLEMFFSRCIASTRDRTACRCCWRSGLLVDGGFLLALLRSWSSSWWPSLEPGVVGWISPPTRSPVVEPVKSIHPNPHVHPPGHGRSIAQPADRIGRRPAERGRGTGRPPAGGRRRCRSRCGMNPSVGTNPTSSGRTPRVSAPRAGTAPGASRLGNERVPVAGAVDQVDRRPPEMQTDRAAARSGVHFVRGARSEVYAPHRATRRGRPGPSLRSGRGLHGVL